MTTKRLAAGLSVAWCLVVAGAFLDLDPDRTLAASPLLAGARSLVVALVALVACTGAGGALLARLSPGSLEVEAGWPRALATGLAAWGLLSLPWSLLFGVRSCPLLLVVLAAGWLFRPPVRLPRPGRVGLAALGLALVPALLGVLAPATSTDEIYYHVALPSRMLGSGHLAGGFLLPNGSRPLALHLPFAALVALGGEGATRAFCLLVGASTLVLVHRRARAWWGPAAGWMAPALLVGSFTFLGQAGVAGNDLVAGFLVLVAADALVEGAWLVPAALAAGGALAVKYTAAAPLLPLFLWAAASARRPRAVLRVLAAGGVAVLWVMPWWGWNVAGGLHPLFPYAGWGEVEGMVYSFPEKFGLGRDLAGWILLPWNAVMRAETDSTVFLGRVNPAFLALAPVAAVVAVRGDRRARALAFTAAGGCLLWAIGPQWLRYLLPSLPPAALACAAGLARLPAVGRWAAWLAWAVGIPANTGPVLAEAVEQAPVALGHESEEDYRARRIPGWTAVRWIRDETPPDARVALLFAWQASPLEREWILGSVEDHVPSRYLLATTGDRALDVLAGEGAEWLLVGTPRFLRKAYPFLSPEVLHAQFEAPVQAMTRLLEARAELVFEDGRYAVWHLPPATEAGRGEREKPPASGYSDRP
ncbi:MAG: hypothetical protein JXB39_01515 [Deltaproteobacteria bacterium]|nr:hypothetical protein [Deltaproteobacteria bacterium]